MRPALGGAARHLGRRVPQARAQQRARALEVHRLHFDHQHRARQLAVHAEAFQQRRIGADAAQAVDAQRLAHARHQEQQGDAWVGQDVAQAVDAVVAAPVGQQQGFLVLDHDESGWVAARRGVQAVRSRRGQHGEGRGLDEGAVMRVDVVHFLLQRGFAGFAVQRLQGVGVGDEMVGIEAHDDVKGKGQVRTAGSSATFSSSSSGWRSRSASTWL